MDGQCSMIIPNKVLQTVKTSLKPPRSNQIFTSPFVELQCLRAFYDNQLKRFEEQNRPSANMLASASLKTPIEYVDSSFFIAAGWSKASSIHNASKNHLRYCVNQPRNWEVNNENLYLVNHTVDKGHMSMNANGAKDRVNSYHWDCCQALEAEGYETVATKSPTCLSGMSCRN